VWPILFLGRPPTHCGYAARRNSDAKSLSFAFSVFVRLTENIRIASEPIYKQSNLCRTHQKNTALYARPTLKFGSLSFTGELFHSRCSFGGSVGHCPRVLLVLIFLSSLSLRLFIPHLPLLVKPFSRVPKEILFLQKFLLRHKSQLSR